MTNMFLLLGVQYAQAERNRQLFRHGQLTIPFIGVADFIKNKEASGPKKDLQDLRRLMPQNKKAVKGRKKRK